MIQQALSVLDTAYAPYSKFRVACCLRDEHGALHRGVNIENIAYGLTCCAEMSAISQMIAAGGREIQDVVVLAENNELCTPCGSCRQRLMEFSNPTTTVYMCHAKGVHMQKKLHELLPYAFKF